MSEPRSKAEEVVRRGEEIYERDLRETLEADEANIGKIIAIDVDTGDYEIGDAAFDAVQRLKDRHPEGDRCVLRIGYDVPDGFGYIPQRTKR